MSTSFSHSRRAARPHHLGAKPELSPGAARPASIGAGGIAPVEAPTFDRCAPPHAVAAPGTSPGAGRLLIWYGVGPMIGAKISMDDGGLPPDVFEVRLLK